MSEGRFVREVFDPSGRRIRIEFSGETLEPFPGYGIRRTIRMDWFPTLDAALHPGQELTISGQLVEYNIKRLDDRTWVELVLEKMRFAPGRPESET